MTPREELLAFWGKRDRQRAATATRVQDNCGEPPPTVLSEQGGFVVPDSTPCPTVGSVVVPREELQPLDKLGDGRNYEPSQWSGLVLAYLVAAAVGVVVGWSVR